MIRGQENENIYLIDDDASVRRSLSRLLALSNWQVRSFDSAEAFLADQDHLPLGGIILDMQLLGMSGLELLRQMASAGQRWPVVAMSGSHDDGTEEEALLLGARFYLRKPFEAEMLLEAIARAFQPGGHTGPRE
jgi:two-component system response regulator FixJ